jgi:galactose mutarotase-like enzyme
VVDVVSLATEAVSLAMRPDNGCDIVSLVDVRTGTDVLWKAPWGTRSPAIQPFAFSSLEHWLNRCDGGWNLLLPNSAAETEGEGVRLGFHGEASVSAWEVVALSPSAATLATNLVTVPLSVRRTVRITGDTLSIEDTLVNESPDPTRFSWGHHPTLGAPFIGAGTRLEIATDRVVLDHDHATTGVDRLAGPARWPRYGDSDLSIVPPAGERRSLLAYLDGSAGRYRVVNDALRLGVEFTWPAATFPHLWLWQEMHATPGYPWFRRVYAMAIEIHSAADSRRPPTTVLSGGGSLTATVTARVFDPLAAG